MEINEVDHEMEINEMDHEYFESRYFFRACLKRGKESISLMELGSKFH